MGRDGALLNDEAAAPALGSKSPSKELWPSGHLARTAWSRCYSTPLGHDYVILQWTERGRASWSLRSMSIDDPTL